MNSSSAVTVVDSAGSGALSLHDVWPQVLEDLAQSFDPQIFTAWIKPLEVGEIADGEVRLFAPNKFSAEHIERTHADVLTAALARRLGSSLRVRVTVSRTLPKNPPASSPVGVTVQRILTAVSDDTNLNTAYNFSNFVVGNCNQFAHAVSLQVSESPGRTYNPLFLYGGVGLGKTHLVNSIGNAVRRRKGKVLLASSESFVNELIAAIRGNRMQQFKMKFRSLDVLIIDDVQFITGKERTQEEFFHTFNELHQRQKQIIITADKLPQDLTGIEERLRTRFASGLAVDLQPPDYETRVAIVDRKAMSLGVHIPPDVSEFLAAQVESNIRELEGALNRLVAVASHRGVPVSLSLCEDAIFGLLPERRISVSIDQVQRAVAQHYSIGVGDILGKRRTHHVASARHVAMYLCRRLTGHSFPEIGTLFGGRDHSTVIHAVRNIEEKIKENIAFKGEITALQKRISG